MVVVGEEEGHAAGVVEEELEGLQQVLGDDLHEQLVGPL